MGLSRSFTLLLILLESEGDLGRIIACFVLKFRKSKNKFLILLGDFNNQNDDGDLDVGEMARNVAEIIIHPSYKWQSLDNDLALIKLESPIEFTK